MSRLGGLLGGLVVALVVVAPACSSEVTDSQQASGSGSTGSGGTGGSGTGGGGGGGPSVCGGKAGTPCAADEWCDYVPPVICGGFDDTGTCAPRPETCPKDCPGVCGCDGAFYCNECMAHASGVDVDPNASCSPPSASYAAYNLFTHVPRFVILKSDPARDMCFRLWVEGIGGTGIGVETTEPWMLTHAEVTDHMSDCALDMGYPVQPAGNSAPAVSGTGTLTITGSFPCEVTIHATISFDTQVGGWVPATEPFDADALSVDGGCS